MAEAETVERPNGRMADRAVDLLGRASHLAHEVKLAKTIATDAAEDGVRAARRAVKQTVYRAQDLVDDTTHEIRRRPLQSIGIAFAAGSCVGILVGWMSRRAVVR
ncbi:MAG: hypothetical protein KGN76_13340 [Acidobacteriota bacterium]|nr:hypothetical protein [Acidobacteriota bacterium]